VIVDNLGVIKIKRTWAYILFFVLLALIIVSQLNIYILKKSRINYIITFRRPIKLPNTFALDTLYSNTHKEIRIRGPVGKGEILIGSDFSSIQEYLDYMNKNAKIFKETKCGINITKFTELKTAPMDSTILQNNEEYIVFAGVEERHIKQAVDSLCISYQK
jgi:hypothetical protein